MSSIARAACARLADRLAAISGVTLWTSPAPPVAAIVTVKPGSADPAKLAAALYEKARVACTARAGADRPGLRFSPHFYNLEAEIDRAVARRSDADDQGLTSDAGSPFHPSKGGRNQRQDLLHGQVR